MEIPRAWASARGEYRSSDGRDRAFEVWGWGDDEAQARRQAATRLERLLAKVRGGLEDLDRYPYGVHPIREEIVRVLDERDGKPTALVTRNRYGALILNTADTLFLDIDLPAPGLGSWFRRLFPGRGASSEEARLTQLRETLAARADGPFRLYRTCAGFRVIAVGAPHDPASDATGELMESTATDPMYRRLCAVQKSFRARLTPKPWRCGIPAPASSYPRNAGAAEAFDRWLASYQEAVRGYTTCRFLGTVGTGLPSSRSRRLVEWHDRETRCVEPLPLA